MKVLLIGEVHNEALSTSILKAVTDKLTDCSVHLEIDKNENINLLWEAGKEEVVVNQRRSVLEQYQSEDIPVHCNDMSSQNYRYSTSPGLRDEMMASGILRDESEYKVLLVGYSHIPGIIRWIQSEECDIKVFLPKDKYMWKVHPDTLKTGVEHRAYFYGTDNLDIAQNNAVDFFTQQSTALEFQEF